MEELNESVKVQEVLDHIARSVYDAMHGLSATQWVVDAIPLMNKLRNLCGVTREAFADAYDLSRFKSRWEALAEDGRCDGWGGAECRRVLKAWADGADRDANIDEFIVREANLGPNGEDGR